MLIFVQNVIRLQFSAIKRKKGSRSSLIDCAADYRLSVKVRAITSRCCSGVRELKRTA